MHMDSCLMESRHIVLSIGTYWGSFPRSHSIEKSDLFCFAVDHLFLHLMGCPDSPNIKIDEHFSKIADHHFGPVTIAAHWFVKNIERFHDRMNLNCECHWYQIPPSNIHFRTMRLFPIQVIWKARAFFHDSERKKCVKNNLVCIWFVMNHGRWYQITISYAQLWRNISFGCHVGR